jgi:hypothetical protein
VFEANIWCVPGCAGYRLENVIHWATMRPAAKSVKGPSYMGLGIEGIPETHITSLTVTHLASYRQHYASYNCEAQQTRTNTERQCRSNVG